MKLWELRSYDDVIRLEQDRLIYRARLRARYGRMWRRRAPVEAVMRLRLTNFGVPLPVMRPTASSGDAPHRPTICAGPTGAVALPPVPATPKPALAAAAPVMRPALRAAAPPKRTPATPPPAALAGPSASAAFDRHTDDALRLAGLSKAAAVRAMCEAHPSAAAPQIAALLTERGITASASYVRTVLSRDSRTRRDTTGTGQYL
jgi:hypothetical protein